jgi:hypothetical protein
VSRCCAGRGDDCRLLGIADLCRPQVLEAIGPASCSVQTCVLNGGKANSSSRPESMVWVRHLDLWVDSKAWLGRLLFIRFAVSQEAFPYPTKDDNYEAW